VAPVEQSPRQCFEIVPGYCDLPGRHPIQDRLGGVEGDDLRLTLRHRHGKSVRLASLVDHAEDETVAFGQCSNPVGRGDQFR